VPRVPHERENVRRGSRDGCTAALIRAINASQHDDSIAGVEEMLGLDAPVVEDLIQRALPAHESVDADILGLGIGIVGRRDDHRIGVEETPGRPP